MKIVRFLSEDHEVHCGVISTEEPGVARLISGSIFGKFEVTAKKKEIREYLAPVEPATVYALGFNYGRHAEEIEVSYPENPVVFIKAATSVIGHGAPVILPKAGPDEVDYEAELAVVIGRKGKNIPKDRAMDHILGYACANDVSARDWQFHKQKNQWTRGKSFDTFCPMGPWLVTREEVENPGDLGIRSILNGTVMQDSRTSDMFFSVEEIVSDLSRSVTLLPGTVILTGTPAGVGFARNPAVFLHEGDRITVEIEGVGVLSNPVFMEK